MTADSDHQTNHQHRASHGQAERLVGLLETLTTEQRVWAMKAILALGPRGSDQKGSHGDLPWQSGQAPSLNYSDRADKAWEIVRTRPEVSIERTVRASGVSRPTVANMRRRWRKLQAAGTDHSVTGNWSKDNKETTR